MAKKINPRRKPATEEDVNRAWKEGAIEGLRLMEAIVMRVMIDKFPDQDLTVFWETLTMYTRQWADGKLSAADIRESLKTEDNIHLLDGPSSAIAHSKRRR